MTHGWPTFQNSFPHVECYYLSARIGRNDVSNQVTCGSLSPHYHHRSASGSSLVAIHLARASGLARNRMNARAACGSEPSDIKAPS